MKNQKNYEKEEGNEALWQTIFKDGHPALMKQHSLHKRLPNPPRCRLCYVPFEGIGGWFMRLRGKKRNSRNPHYCNACDGFIKSFPGGAEVEMSVLYVDIRHSTDFAVAAEPSEVGARINYFLNQATKAITDRGGFVMAFYGDCVVAVWPPGFSGDNHVQLCLETAKALSDPTMFEQSGNSIPVGVGAHVGKVFIGTVSAAEGHFRDVSIFGSNVNLTARLAAQAGEGQALISKTLLDKAKIQSSKVLDLELKGFTEPVQAAVLGD